MGQTGLAFIIRAAELGDIDKAVALSRITQSEHADRLPLAFSRSDAPFAARAYPEIIKRKMPGEVFVAVRDGDIIGHIGYHVVDMPAPEKHHHRAATVLDLSVSPSCRGRGVGGQLLARALDEMKLDGVTRVDAQVWNDNTSSEKMFESAGFEATFREFRMHLAPSKTGLPRHGMQFYAQFVRWLWLPAGALFLWFASR